MSFYNTGNPVPSIDPRDLDDNAKHIDEIVNSTELTFVDRLGTSRRTLAGINIFERPEAGAVPRAVEQKLLELPTPADFGAVGNGVADDRQALISAQAAAGEAPLESGKSYNFGDLYTGADDPNFKPRGYGSLVWNSIPLGGYNLQFDIKNASIYSTPDSWFRATRAFSPTSPLYPPFAPPGRGGDLTNIFNTVISQGSKLLEGQATGVKVVQVTAYGSNIGDDPTHWLLVDAYGQDAMMFAQLAERCSALGSEVFVWGGSESRADVIAHDHDMYRNELPNSPTWDFEGLETKFPGVGMRIWNFTDYAVDTTGFARNGGFARDAGNQIVRGTDNVFSGYGSAHHMYAGSFNSGYGVRSLANVVFGDSETAVGFEAGRDAIDSPDSFFGGHGAGCDLKTSPRVTVVGARAANGVTSAPGAVLNGYKAGQGLSGQLAEAYVLATESQSVRSPLICGKFVTGLVGLNLPPAELRAKFHIRANSATGSVLALDSGSDGLLIERNAATGMTIEVPIGSFGNITHATPSTNNAAKYTYSHGSSSHQFSIAASEKLRISATEVRPGTNNNASLGTNALQWSDFRSVNGAFSGPLRFGQFTLATLPSAAAFSGYVIDVTDATGGPKVCRSNGTAWQILNTTTTVS